MCWCFEIMIITKIFYPSLSFSCKVSFFVMSEAIYSKDKVFDLWCSEVDWVGKEFRSRSKGEGEWGLSDKQAPIEKKTLPNKIIAYEPIFFWKFKTNMYFFSSICFVPRFSYLSSRSSSMSHLSMRNLHQFTSFVYDYVLYYALPSHLRLAKWPNCSRRSSSFCAKSSLCHLVIK